ncbi:DinB superfamily protein [Maioricimonas rarisocia]|uniref:DinB superfamily protein n=1 Tax=Maioricimonas rarisocia TaxID=2528026 RepID=A0A517Z4K2_9PLAN|nr:DinB family protein [Maioricimonas rarisocia]QDU37410.1 DinB superfamily protein [Maioricimonas rarisocia]
MDSVDLIRRLHQHRTWAHERLLDAAEDLTPEQLRQTFPIGQGSVWKTLCHLYGAEYVWLAAIRGDENPLTPGDVPGRIPGNQEGEGAASDLADLRSRWERVNVEWAEYLESLTPESLEKIVRKMSSSSGAGRVHGTRLADVLLHLCLHAQYTTAQLVNMMRHLGCERLPDGMMITLARSEAAAGEK